MTPRPEEPEVTAATEWVERIAVDGSGDVPDEADALRHDRIAAAELQEAGIDVTVDDRLPEQISDAVQAALPREAST